MRDTQAEIDDATLRYHLSVPFVAVVESVEDESGRWLRRAEYPELEGCVVAAGSAVEAIALLEQLRVRLIVQMLESGVVPPVPRPPLSSGVSGLSEQALDDLVRCTTAAP